MARRAVVALLLLQVAVVWTGPAGAQAVDAGSDARAPPDAGDDGGELPSYPAVELPPVEIAPAEPPPPVERPAPGEGVGRIWDFPPEPPARAESAKDAGPGAGLEGAPRVFLDCPACDQDFVRSEIRFVDYVRHREDADVHVLVASQATGAGGTEYTARFIGRRGFAGADQVLRYTSAQTDTRHARRQGLTRLLELGLVRYAAETALASRLRVGLEAPRGRVEAEDPWDAWVFRVAVGGQITGEQATALTSLDATLAANRTTERWKLLADLTGEYGEQRFDFGEGETLETTSHTVSGRTLVARALSPHWSLGLAANGTSSTFLNYRLRARVAPGVEYSVFPYSESTRRILTILYSVGFQSLSYREETLFGRLSERRPDHALQTTLTLLQPWGTASLSGGGSQFLDLTDKYRLTAVGTLDVRLARGLSLDVSANVAHRRDQINLPRGSAPDEQILLRQRELATGYEYDLRVGFSYTFGSIHDNVVNPRYRDAGGI